jgi:hypothetical protein
MAGEAANDLRLCVAWGAVAAVVAPALFSGKLKSRNEQMYSPAARDAILYGEQPSALIESAATG